MHACVCACAHPHACMHACAHAYTHACTHARMHARKRTTPPNDTPARAHFHTPGQSCRNERYMRMHQPVLILLDERALSISASGARWLRLGHRRSVRAPCPNPWASSVGLALGHHWARGRRLSAVLTVTSHGRRQRPAACGRLVVVASNPGRVWCVTSAGMWIADMRGALCAPLGMLLCYVRDVFCELKNPGT